MKRSVPLQDVQDLDEEWGEDEEPDPVADPFIYSTGEGAFVLVSPAHMKQVSLPSVKQKGGTDLWQLRYSYDTKKWVIESHANATKKAPARMIDQVFSSKYAVKMDDATLEECKQCLV